MSRALPELLATARLSDESNVSWIRPGDGGPAHCSPIPEGRSILDQFTDGLGDAWSSVAEFLPKLVGFFLILIVGYFVAKAIAKIVDKVLERVGFDRAVERGGVGRALARSRYDASSLLGKVVFYALFLFVLQLAFGVFGPNPISDLIHGVIAYLPNVFVAILIIVIGAAIAAGVKEIVEASLGGLSYGRAVALGASAAVLVVAAFAALDQLQIAPRIVTGLFYALLAILVGSAIVAIGGGGIWTMRSYWERMSARADQEASRVRAHAQGAKERVRDRAQDRAEQIRPDDFGTESTIDLDPAGRRSQRP
jgi:mechanosensitive ion channel-like protein